MIEEQKKESGLPEIKEIEAKPSKKEEQPKKSAKQEKAEPPKSTDSLQDLVLKNIKLSEEIFKQNKKIKSRLNLMLAGGYLKLVLIIAPLVFAVIYLGPMMSRLLAQYSSLLGGTSGAPLNFGSLLDPSKIDINNILSNILPEDAVKLQGMLKNLPK